MGVLLVKPDRDLTRKRDWRVVLGGKKARVGVFLDAAGLATDMVLDGVPGRFYYRRLVKGYVGMAAREEPAQEAAAEEASRSAATP